MVSKEQHLKLSSDLHINMRTHIHKTSLCYSCMLVHMSIPAFRKLKQEGLHCEASLSCAVNLMPAWET